MWTIKRTIDLKYPERVPAKAAPIPLMYPGDAQGHTIQLTVLDNGAAAQLTGTPYGFFTRADGQTVVVAGTIAANVISVQMSYDCYAVRGGLRAVIRMGNPIVDPGDPCTSLLELDFYVREGFGSTYTPSGVFPTLEGLVNGGIVDIVYPVGSIYMSTANTSPATLFPGTAWTQIKDTFLLSAGDTYTAGNTGGEATHTLTTEELPADGVYIAIHQCNKEANGYGLTTTSGFQNRPIINDPNKTSMIKSENLGSGDPHNNMPPYLVVYMWRRTA